MLKTKRKTKVVAAKVKRTMSPAQIKARQKWQAKQLKAGKCVACTRKAIMNKLTGKRGMRCRAHQDAANKYNQKYKKGGKSLKLDPKAVKLAAKRKHDAEVKRQKRAALKAAKLAAGKEPVAA